MTQAQLIKRVIKPLAFFASLGPLAWLLRDILTGNLGANPVERITHFTGLTSLTFLMITLTVTPARKLLGLSALIQLRRMLGLYAFFYAVLHFTIYGLDRTFFEGTGWSLSVIAADVSKRPYITVGFTAFLILCSLAATSTNGMVKRLGGKRWQRLHQLVYVAAALGVLAAVFLLLTSEPPELAKPGGSTTSAAPARPSCSTATHSACCAAPTSMIWATPSGPTSNASACGR